MAQRVYPQLREWPVRSRHLRFVPKLEKLDMSKCFPLLSR